MTAAWRDVPERTAARTIPAGLDPVVLAHEAFAQPPGAVVAFVLRLVERHRLGARPRVLDLACGSGRRLPAFATMAAGVLGMESDPRLRQAAQRRATGEIEVRPGGFRELEAGPAHDVVVAWDGALAYLHRFEQRLAALRACLAALRPGGILVLDLPHLLWTMAHGDQPRLAATQAAPGLRVTREARQELDLDGGLVTVHERYRLEGPQASAEEVELVHRLSIVTPQELAFGLRQAGFTRVETWSSLSAPEPGPLSGPRMVVVARR